MNYDRRFCHLHGSNRYRSVKIMSVSWREGCICKPPPPILCTDVRVVSVWTSHSQRKEEDLTKCQTFPLKWSWLNVVPYNCLLKKVWYMKFRVWESFKQRVLGFWATSAASLRNLGQMCAKEQKKKLLVYALAYINVFVCWRQTAGGTTGLCTVFWEFCQCCDWGLTEFRSN